MTTGATDTFTQTRDEICTDALINVGAIGPGKTASGALLTHAARALNRLVKSIDADGQFLWRMVRRTTTTTSGTATFTPATDVLDVDSPMSYIKAGQTGRSTIEPMSRDEFMSLGDRTSTGTPTRFLAERVLASNQITITWWPVPDTTGDTIEYAVALRAKEFVAGSDTPDFNSKWILTLVYGLTMELAPGYAQPELIGTYMPLYNAEKKRVLADETERGSTFLVPFGGMSY